MKSMPIELAHVELGSLTKSLGLLAGWETLNYHKESESGHLPRRGTIRANHRSPERGRRPRRAYVRIHRTQPH